MDPILDWLLRVGSHLPPGSNLRAAATADLGPIGTQEWATANQTWRSQQRVADALAALAPGERLETVLRGERGVGGDRVAIPVIIHGVDPVFGPFQYRDEVIVSRTALRSTVDLLVSDLFGTRYPGRAQTLTGYEVIAGTATY